MHFRSSLHLHSHKPINKTTMTNPYADLEIRILNQTSAGYPLELTLNAEQEFSGGQLDPG